MSEPKRVRLNFPKEWWMEMAKKEGNHEIGAGVSTYEDRLVSALRNLTLMARTSGGTAGRDEGLCAACDFAEAVLTETAPDPASIRSQARREALEEAANYVLQYRQGLIPEYQIVCDWIAPAIRSLKETP